MIHRLARATLPLLVLIGLLLVSAGCRGNGISKSTAKFPAGTGFIQHQVMIDGASRPVWVFIPKNYRPGERYPTIVFLHGLFEAGQNDEGALTAGLGPVIAKHPEAWQFITIFPQSTGTWRGDDRERFVMASLDSVEARYAVDPDRVTLAGLSYGGLGVWEIGAKHPERFSALVPVASPHANAVVERIAMLPIWAFNFRGDWVVPSYSTDQMCEQLTARGGKPKQTKFDGIGHDCWTKAVEESNVVAWMMEQRISARATTASNVGVADVR